VARVLLKFPRLPENPHLRHEVPLALPFQRPAQLRNPLQMRWLQVPVMPVARSIVSWNPRSKAISAELYD